MRLKTKIDELKSDPRYQFMFSGMLVADTMADFIAKIFRLPAKGKPISIIDVSGVPSDIISVVVAVLSRLVFDYAIWSRSEVQRPVLLVCEEAHRYVPSDKTSSGQAVRKILERIAKEGRKYGVSLGLITQRPSDLAEGVLSQCGTIIAMRLNNDRDQAFVKSGDARRRARLPRRHPGAAQPRMHRLRRGRLDPDPRLASTISSATAARPRPTRSSPSCGGRPATRRRWSPASSSAGAPRGARPAHRHPERRPGSPVQRRDLEGNGRLRRPSVAGGERAIRAPARAAAARCRLLRLRGADRRREQGAQPAAEAGELAAASAGRG